MTILISVLFLYQRINALKTFLPHSLQYKLASGGKPSWKTAKMIKKNNNNSLSFPEGEYLYPLEKPCFVGLSVASIESDVNAIDTEFKLLTSRHHILQQIALDNLKSTTRRRLGHNPNDDELGRFMNGDNDLYQ
ncbi:hypothetical protein CEXT_296371 [Caerostris extrusa]|uniref:Uncharacterized protein n=1 Tax=Caerostris extrusa TaxID=172846 RepID=A0AAV4U9X2_CAEEX|nr:hypothetical protein CEXT_296371 [Caerostris extrusa]